jgi:hypothetical protein
MQHRRESLLQQTAPIRQVLYLPDHPLEVPGIETHDYHRHVVPTLATLYRDTREFILEGYRLTE